MRTTAICGPRARKQFTAAYTAKWVLWASTNHACAPVNIIIAYLTCDLQHVERPMFSWRHAKRAGLRRRMVWGLHSENLACPFFQLLWSFHTWHLFGRFAKSTANQSRAFIERLLAVDWSVPLVPMMGRGEVLCFSVYSVAVICYYFVGHM